MFKYILRQIASSQRVPHGYVPVWPCLYLVVSGLEGTTNGPSLTGTFYCSCLGKHMGKVIQSLSHIGLEKDCSYRRTSLLSGLSSFRLISRV